jgi:hypothetical protein
MCPLLAQLKIGFFSSFSDAAVYSTNEANKAGLKQTIIFRCLWIYLYSSYFVFGVAYVISSTVYIIIRLWASHSRRDIYFLSKNEEKKLFF